MFRSLKWVNKHKYRHTQSAFCAAHCLKQTLSVYIAVEYFFASRFYVFIINISMNGRVKSLWGKKKVAFGFFGFVFH